jgi:hypothetical protein
VSQTSQPRVVLDGIRIAVDGTCLLVLTGDERGEQLRLTTTSRDTVAAFNKYIAKRQVRSSALLA